MKKRKDTLDGIDTSAIIENIAQKRKVDKSPEIPTESFDVILKKMCYRQVRSGGRVIWVKPFATTLLVIIPNDTVFEFYQIFGSAESPKVWNSDIKSYSELQHTKDLQELESLICRHATLGYTDSYQSLVPELDWLTQISEQL